jgi:hypothetical protein
MNARGNAEVVVYLHTPSLAYALVAHTYFSRTLLSAPSIIRAY